MTIQVTFLVPPDPPGRRIHRLYAGGFGTVERKDPGVGTRSTLMPPIFSANAAAIIEAAGNRASIVDAQSEGLTLWLPWVRSSARSPTSSSSSLRCRHIEDGVTGIVYSPGPSSSAEEALTDSLTELIENHSLAERMGRRGGERALSRFTWAKTAERTIGAYARDLEGI